MWFVVAGLRKLGTRQKTQTGCLTLQDASVVILIPFLVDLIRLCVEYLVGAGETLLGLESE